MTPAAVPPRTEREPVPRRPRALDFVERCERAFEAFAARPYAVILAFTALYIYPTLQLAAHRLFWDDEFFTLYLSTTKTWSDLYAALYTGADQHPPSFYWLTHGILHAFGTSHLTLRLTAIVGFWLACVCIYFIARSMMKPSWAVVAMSIPLASPAYYYATEGRGYGLELGFAALAVLAWIRAGEARHRGLWVGVLGASLAGAVACHYYALLMAAAIAAAELTRSWLTKKIDFAVWLAICAAAAPIVVFAPLILHARHYAGHFWAWPHWTAPFGFYMDFTGYAVMLLLGGAVIGIVARALPRGHTVSQSAPRFRLWNFSVLCYVTAIPVLGTIVAKFVTHAMADRYVLPAIIGAVVIAAYGLSVIARCRSWAAMAVVAGAIVCFGLETYSLRNIVRLTYEDVAYNIEFLDRHPGVPVAVSEVTIFHRLSFYAPPRTVDRITYVSDPDLSVKYLGHDTIDRGLLDLNPWFPLRVVPLESYLAANSHFLVYGYIGPWTWLADELCALRSAAARLDMIDRRGQRLLLDVHGPLKAFKSDTAEHWRNYEKTGLYWRLPRTRQTLCAQYMGAQSCPDFGR